MEMGLHPNVLDCHQLSTWQFDQEGKLLIPDNEYNQRALVQQAERMMMNVYTEQMATLNKLKTRFQSNVGGLSKNEQIYLEDSQALAIVQLAATNFDLALEKVMKHYKNGIHELEDLWREGLFALQNITPDLAYDEMIAVIQAVGCTEQTVAIVPAEIFQEKVNQVRQLSNKFTSLKEEIIGKIGQLVQQDHELASQIV